MDSRYPITLCMVEEVFFFFSMVAQCMGTTDLEDFEAQLNL
jgi:hypothetical protein